MVEVTRRRSKINPESDELVRGMPTIVQDLMQTKGATILELGRGLWLLGLPLAMTCRAYPNTHKFATYYSYYRNRNRSRLARFGHSAQPLP